MSEQPPFEPVSYSSADGKLRLFARDYPPESRGPGHLPLLMMHGLTRNSADFEPLVEALGPARRMIVPDQRGRGRSEYDSDPANYRPDVYVGDMWVMLDTLCIRSVIPVGTSLGGLVAMLMAATQPQRIAGIVLNDVGPELMEEGLDRIRGYVGGGGPMESWEEAAQRCEAIASVAFDGFGPDDWMKFARRCCVERPDGKIILAYDPKISAGMADEQPTTVPPDLWPLWDLLTDIPILVIRGAKSDLLAPATVSEMAKRHSAEFTHVDVSGRGHAPMLDEPAAVKAITEFLAKLP